MPRYVLLGASNLTMGFPLIVENLRGDGDEPVEVFAAMGYGRSYGSWSRVLVRELPGITECGLWDAVGPAAGNDRGRDNPPAGPLRALITDVGNDLLYGFCVDRIVEWVAWCIDRLQKLQAAIVLTLPPLESVDSLSAWRFTLMRTLLFPSCRLSFPAVHAAAVELDERLAKLGAARGIPVVAPSGDWYGFDPIHVRRRHRPAAWRTILSRWPGFDATSWRAKPRRRLKQMLRSCRPDHYRLWGRDRSAGQPVLRNEELTVSLF